MLLLKTVQTNWIRVPDPSDTAHTWNDLAAWSQHASLGAPDQLWLVETGWPLSSPQQVKVRARCYNLENLDFEEPSPLLLGVWHFIGDTC